VVSSVHLSGSLCVVLEHTHISGVEGLSPKKYEKEFVI